MSKVDIVLIIPPFHMRNGGGSFFPLGTSYIISALEKADYSYEVVNCTEFISSYYKEDLTKLESDLEEKLNEYAPLVVGIGPCITTQVKALGVIASITKKVYGDIPVFAGGPFASIDGQEWFFYDMLGINYIVKGDGEEAVPDVVRAIKREGDIRKSKCVSYSGYSYVNAVKDINVLAFPHRDFTVESTYSVRRKSMNGNQAVMIASRGCPYACSYCVSGNMKKSKVPFRRRSNENIVEEMQELKEMYGIGDIVFYDDCFFSNKSRLSEDIKAFCDLLLKRKVNVQWQIEMRPDFFVLLSEEDMNSLSEAGCRQINLGIEKVSQNGLHFLGKDGNTEGLKEKITATKERTGIKISATFILGGEGEDEDDVKKLVEYAKGLSIDFAHFNPLFVYPGTPLYDKVFSNEREWVDAILKDDFPWGEIVYENKGLDRKQLLRLIDYAYGEFYKDTELAHEQMVEDRFNIKRVEGE